jgi:hypothetical protein
MPTLDGGQVLARLGTNNQDESVSSGGLKENATFTVSATFDLVVPQYAGQEYGIVLDDSSATRSSDELIEIYVIGDGHGGATVKLVQGNFTIPSFTTLASQVLTADQLAGNNQIELDLAHLVKNTSDITGSFELFNHGTQTFADTFATTGHAFNNTTYTRAGIYAYAPMAAVVTGQAEEGQTLTANTVTNDGDTTINYQWQHSSDGTHWSNIGSNSATYAVQESDEGLLIRVTASTADADSTKTISVSSAPTAAVTDIPGGDLFVTLDSATAQQGAAIHVTAVTDGGTPVAAASYDWQVSSDGIHWSEAHGANGQSSYTPVDADQGLQLQLVTTLAGDLIGPESTISHLGTVQAPTAPAAIGQNWTTASDGHGGADIVSDPLSIYTAGITVTQNPNGTATISGLRVWDNEAADNFAVSASTESASSTISPSSVSGNLGQVSMALSSITYNPTAHGAAPQSDQVDLTVADNLGASATVHFIFNEAGQGSTISLQGTAGNDVIFATGHDDTLTGNGGLDHFIFKPTLGTNGVVEHTVTDFDANLDTIDLRQFVNIGSTAAALATAAQQGNDTLLTLDSHDTVLLKNVLAANLHAGDFIVTPHTV